MAQIDRFHERVSSILLKDWDPIGVHDVPAARDEYDQYVGSIADMLAAGTSASDLSRHLIEIEIGTMGLRGDRDRARRVAESLCRAAGA
jgi:hypothetical protein